MISIIVSDLCTNYPVHCLFNWSNFLVKCQSLRFQGFKKLEMTVVGGGGGVGQITDASVENVRNR